MRAMRAALVSLLFLLTLASAPVLAALGVLLGVAAFDLAAISGLTQRSDLAASLLAQVSARPMLIIALIGGLELGVLGLLGLNALRDSERQREPDGRA